jgi:hypothetical protein
MNRLSINYLQPIFFLRELQNAIAFDCFFIIYLYHNCIGTYLKMKWNL